MSESDNVPFTPELINIEVNDVTKLFDRYITVTYPLHTRYIPVTYPLHHHRPIWDESGTMANRPTYGNPSLSTIHAHIGASP